MAEREKKRSKYRLKNYNFKLVFYAVVISILGIAVVRSASSGETVSGMFSTAQKQVMAVGIGIVLMVLLSFIDYHILLKYSWLIYLLNIGLLLYVRFLNPYTFMGAKRWIYLPGFGTVQPSEFSKIAVALTAAWILVRIRKRINNVFFILLYLLITGVTAVLILIEPNLSTTLEVIWGIVTMLFIAGISWKWVVGVLSTLAVLIGLFLFTVYQPDQVIFQRLEARGVIQDYQVDRINAYFFPEDYPDEVYQQTNSVLAIGGGQLSGKGLDTDDLESVKNGGFLSEEQSDFVFAVVGEELGFVGCMILILLYALIMVEGFRIAARSPDLEGKVIAGGMVSTFAFQTFVNMGVATMILPNTGTPLPFISAGMSSVIGSYMMVGILLNIGLQKSRRHSILTFYNEGEEMALGDYIPVQVREEKSKETDQ